MMSFAKSPAGGSPSGFGVKGTSSPKKCACQHEVHSKSLKPVASQLKTFERNDGTQFQVRLTCSPTL